MSRLTLIVPAAAIALAIAVDVRATRLYNQLEDRLDRRLEVVGRELDDLSTRMDGHDARWNVK